MEFGAKSFLAIAFQLYIVLGYSAKTELPEKLLG